MRLRMVFTLTTVLFIALLATTPAAKASCTAATLTGGYGFTTAGGYSQTSTSRLLDAANVGWIVFDGAGSWAASWTNSDHGAINLGVTDSGTYTVSSNCTGSLTNIGSDLHFAFVIVTGGKELLGIQTDSGATVTVDFLKQ